MNTFVFANQSHPPTTEEKKPYQMSALSRDDVLVGFDSLGFVVRTESGDNEFRFGFLLQPDQDIFFNTEGLTINNGVSSTPITGRNTVDRIWLRRARPIITGQVLKYNTFVFVPDFGQGQSRLFDALLDIQHIQWLGFSAGKQISLIAGLEQFKDQASLYTLEPGYATSMAPNREIGFVLHGEWSAPGVEDAIPYVDQRGFNQRFAYQIGLFSGTADNTNPGLNPTSITGFNTETATLENKAIEVRIFSNPFLGRYHRLEGLGLGFASSFDTPHDQSELPALLSVGQNPIFVYSSHVAANGARYRFHPQGYWYVGPFGFVSDWAFTAQHISNHATGDTQIGLLTHIMQHNRAGQMQLIYNITGEKNTYRERINPKRPFSLSERGAYGAFQLVLRWSRLTMDSNVFQDNTLNEDTRHYAYADPRISVSRANTLSIGLNWVLNQHVRFLTEYDQTSFIGGCSTGGMSASLNPGCLTSGTAAFASTSQVLNRPDEKIIMQRVQIQY